MNKSEVYYNELAKKYRNISISRQKYLSAIDQLILDRLKGIEVSNYLDIGAGDGVRSLYISESINSKNTILLDNSTKISENIKQNDNVKLINESIFSYDTDIKFDVITCLWNVIGHFENENQRVLFFKKVKSLLSKNGVLIFDVNNRYNIEYYGFKNVMNNLEREKNNDPEKGLFTLEENGVKTKVFVHSPFEVKKYLKESGLMLDNVMYVNYETGELMDTYFEGQLLYTLK